MHKHVYTGIDIKQVDFTGWDLYIYVDEILLTFVTPAIRLAQRQKVIAIENFHYIFYFHYDNVTFCFLYWMKYTL